MISQKITGAAPLNREIERFLHEMKGWIDDCIEEFASVDPIDIHDQGTYTTGWEPYIQAVGGDSAVYSFLAELRDKIRMKFTNNGQWKHGYWTMQEAHHGTEHFELFLGAMFRIHPTDEETIRQLVDAAEHMGNWSGEVPDWFDWGENQFLSMHFGTDGILKQAGAELNIPDHLRCINICLLAHQATGESRYLDISKRYGLLWSEAILAQTELPIGINRKGVVCDLLGDMNHEYRNFVGEIPEDMSKPVDRAENILASGGIDTLLTLYSITDEEMFRKAIEKILDILVMEVGDPDAGAAVHILRKYRQLTNSKKYDLQIIQEARRYDPYAITEIGLGPMSTPAEDQCRPSGIGKRTDMPSWYENGKVRRQSPILLSLAAEISKDKELAARSVQLARVYMNLARRTFTHGREHGCKGPTVSSVARGHGRDNHAGMATAVFKPIWDTFML